jgi:hypothetical protein
MTCRHPKRERVEFTIMHWCRALWCRCCGALKFPEYKRWRRPGRTKKR